MIFPMVPDLTRTKLITREAPVLEKAMPAYQLLQRQLVLKDLKQRADQLAVRLRTLIKFFQC